MSADGFWLFEGLEDQPYGLLPLNNLSGKGGATSTKSVERVGSYQWRLEEDEPVIMLPGQPVQSFFWPGGRLAQDRGVLVYDINHLKMKNASLDTMILAAKWFGEGLFRIDCERVGKTVLLSRMEASDLMEIGHLTFDQGLKAKITKPRSKHSTGPFFQLVSYQFGSFKILVRYEVDCADYAAIKAADPPDLSFIEYGDIPKTVPLQLVTTYPHGGGFPFFTWAQLFFSNADQEIVGFFKGSGDFGKQSLYALPDVSKLMKPLPYVVLSKVHDCLDKIKKFLVKNDKEFRCGLIWKGKAHLEIYAKHDDAEGAISAKVREYLRTQCKEPEDEAAPST
ncbi:hypothetical protein M3Y94_01158400 [Aphelenchoides besseyi]|nr:hypothetical protein M3Y94_01158400 [Aphelenchoides besseyi]